MEAKKKVIVFLCEKQKQNKILDGLDFFFLISFILFSFVFCEVPLYKLIDGVSSILRMLQSICLFQESLWLPGDNSRIVVLGLSHPQVDCAKCPRSALIWTSPLALVGGCISVASEETVRLGSGGHMGLWISDSFIHLSPSALDAETG